MSDSTERRICILDAGPIIHLDQMDAFDLIHSLGTVFIPESVVWEAEKYRPSIRAKLGSCIVEDVEDIGPKLASALQSTELQTGEVAALAWAEKFGADLFVSDDKSARVVATILGYESTGTLGVIRNAFHMGALKHGEAVALLRSIPVRSTLHVEASLLASVIRSLR